MTTTTTTLNLGILAHVDAGKTTLTERILFETGVIPTIGRVDHGTTQTDTLQLERQRGITIQSAVASFTLADLRVNLIDTPGHADFIAEVDRALRVLDAVLLVVSAVDGVQPQTRRLVQALKSANVPFVIFVNKIDRLGARGLELLPEIGRALDLTPVAMSAPAELGTAAATSTARDPDDQEFTDGLCDALATVDDDFLARFVATDGKLTSAEVFARLACNVAETRITPVFFGSAFTGAGVSQLLEVAPRLLPTPEQPADGPLSALLFKMQRSAAGEKIALVRIFSGSLQVRDQVPIRRVLPDGSCQVLDARITGLELIVGSKPVTTTVASAGDIVRVHGLREALIGDLLGEPPVGRNPPRLPNPTLESVIHPLEQRDASRMFAALTRLEEQDPLISIRRGAREPVVSVRLYGEVQKEVIQATLRDEFNLEVEFASSQTICIERVAGVGAALDTIGQPENPFFATVGIRISPGPVDGGLVYHRELGSLPLAFYRAIEETVRATLEEGLHGWPVRDSEVTITEVGYWDPVSTASDFRRLTPLVLMSALREAGIVVHEPVDRFTLELPPDNLGETYGRLIAAGAEFAETNQSGARFQIAGFLPAAGVDRFEQLVPGLTGGVGSFRSEPGGYRPIAGEPPSRIRTDFDPLNRKRYLAAVSQM